jgi:predicted nucleic acid-binding protein
MIVLDTNVISEPLRPAGNAGVLAWLDSQVTETLYLSTISLAELRFGVAVLPAGKRRSGMARVMERIVALFSERILAFDDAAATASAELRVAARKAGRAISLTDSYIAAIAKAHGFAVATRDTAPFQAAGVAVIDPWKEGRAHTS